MPCSAPSEREFDPVEAYPSDGCPAGTASAPRPSGRHPRHHRAIPAELGRVPTTEPRRDAASRRSPSDLVAASESAETSVFPCPERRQRRTRKSRSTLRPLASASRRVTPRAVGRADRGARPTARPGLPRNGLPNAPSERDHRDGGDTAAGTRDLTKGPIWRAVAAVAAPMSLGVLGVPSIGLADACFLGRLGEDELAAVGFIYPVTTAVTSLSIGLPAGANAALSQSLGRGDDERVTSRLAFHALGLATLLSVAVALAFWLGSGPLLGAFGASGAVAVAAYAPVWALSFPFLVSMMVPGAMFRAHGDGGTAAMVMLLAAGVNIGLDPLLIVGWGPVPFLGVAGAAWATLAGRAAALALSLLLVLRRGLPCGPDRLLADLGDSARQVGRVGSPAAFSNAINPAGMAAVTAAVATLGDTAVAGFGASARVQSVVLVPLLALSSGIGPVVGRNWGAERPDRAQRAVVVTFAFCAAYGLAAALVLFFLGGPIARLIAPDAEGAGSGGAAEYGARYLRVVGWSLFGYGVLIAADAATNARSRAGHSMTLSLLRILALYLPLAWIGVSSVGYTGVLAAAVTANLAAAWGALVAVRQTGLLDIDMAPVARPAERLPGGAAGTS